MEPTVLINARSRCTALHRNLIEWSEREGSHSTIQKRIAAERQTQFTLQEQPRKRSIWLAPEPHCVYGWLALNIATSARLLLHDALIP